MHYVIECEVFSVYTVALPPLAKEDSTDHNLDNLDMDKKLSKELNLTNNTSDSNNSHHTNAVSTSAKKQGQNEVSSCLMDLVFP